MTSKIISKIDKKIRENLEPDELQMYLAKTFFPRHQNDLKNFLENVYPYIRKFDIYIKIKFSGKTKHFLNSYQESKMDIKTNMNKLTQDITYWINELKLGRISNTYLIYRISRIVREEVQKICPREEDSDVESGFKIW